MERHVEGRGYLTVGRTFRAPEWDGLVVPLASFTATI